MWTAFIFLTSLFTCIFPFGNGFHIFRKKSSHRCISKYTIEVVQSSKTKLVSSSKSNDAEEIDSISGIRQWLIERFGCTEHQLDCVIQDKQYQKDDYSKLESRAIWLQERLCLNDNELNKLIQRSPIILARKPDTNLEPKFAYLQKRLDLNDFKLKSIIQRNPGLLGYSIEENIQPKLSYLQERLLFNETQVAKIITKQPTILNINLEEKLEQNVAWLQQRLDLSSAEESRIIWKMPQLLYLSISNSVEPNLDWLQNRLESSHLQTRRIVMRFPQILVLSIEDKMETTLQWLQHRLQLENNTDLANVIEKAPSLLGCNIGTNLEPTLDFCIEALGDEQEAIQAIKNFPPILSYSLEKRLKPRLKEAKKAGMVIDTDCLNRMATRTKPAWDKSITLYKAKQR